MPGNLRLAFDFDDKEHTVMLTVAEDDCDPAYKVLQEGTQILSMEEDGRDWVLQSMDLPQILEVIPVFLAKARTKWETEPRYAKYAKPRAPRATKKGEKQEPVASSAEEAASPAEPVAPPAEEATPPAEGEAPVDSGELPLLGQASESGDWPGGYEGEAPAEEPTAESPDPVGVAQAVEASAEAPPAPQASEEPAAEVPAPSPSSNGSGKWVYKVYHREGEIMLLSGGHPPEDAEDDSWTCSTYSSTHDALRDLGVTQEEIDKHKYWHRWDRLPFSHQRRIEKVAI